MRPFLLLNLLLSPAAFSAVILPITNPTFNGAVTGSALTATTLTSQLPEANGVQGIKLYLQDPVTGVPEAGGSSTIIAILGASGTVGGTSAIPAGTPFTISYDFTLQRDPALLITSLVLAADIYTPGEPSSISYVSEGEALSIGSVSTFSGSFNTLSLNALEAGAFVEISVYLQANFGSTPAGQNVTLTIPGSSIDIFASPAAQSEVPEPATASLIAAAGGLLLLSSRRRSR